MNLDQMIKENQFTVVDVRTPEEFAGGHVANSINIPLHELQQRLDEIKKIETPIVLCCASGGRSGQANIFLTGQQVDCCNGGSWLDVNYLLSKN